MMNTRARRTTIAALAATALWAVPAVAQATVVADWEMNEGPDASVMVDSAGNHDVNIPAGVGVETGVPTLDGGSAYRFSGNSAWIEVADAADLNPDTRDMTITARVTVAGTQMLDDSYEVVRKGVVKTAGGEWKMEIKRKGTNATIGQLHCVFKGVLPGAKPLASKISPVDVVDGKPHTLQCIRTATTVTAIVDGGRSYTLTKSTGTISNTSTVMLGSKIAGDDVMQGDIDWVRLEIG